MVSDEKIPGGLSLPGISALFSTAVGLFSEIAVVEALEAAAVTRLVLGHLVHRIMDSVEIELLGEHRELLLAGAGAVLGVDAHFKVLLRAVGEHLAEELGELRGMLCFLESTSVATPT